MATLVSDCTLLPEPGSADFRTGFVVVRSGLPREGTWRPAYRGRNGAVQEESQVGGLWQLIREALVQAVAVPREQRARLAISSNAMISKEN